MTPADMLPLLAQWAARHAELSAQMDALAAPFGGDATGPLFDAVWRTWDAYTDQLAARVGDQAEWLSWYCNENDMGRKRLAVISGTRSLQVRTVRQLATVIAGPW